jgi:hypothetical protein
MVSWVVLGLTPAAGDAPCRHHIVSKASRAGDRAREGAGCWQRHLPGMEQSTPLSSCSESADGSEHYVYMLPGFHIYMFLGGCR